MRSHPQDSHDTPIGGDQDSLLHNEDDSDSVVEDVVEHDRTILHDEEERERLLTKDTPIRRLQKVFGSHPKDGGSIPVHNDETKKQKTRRRRRERKRRGGKKEEDGEFLFEMEERGLRDTSSEASSSSLDLQKHSFPSRSRKKSRSKFRRVCMILCLIILLFLIILAGAYNASSKRQWKSVSAIKSNGTSLFGPTTILVSLDGFRADYLNRGLTPRLNAFIKEGISPQYMLPSFPSVTFPNHFTLVTGLYPESHGVVGNTFWDPKLEEEFYYTDPGRSMQPKWWQAEPLWVTAEHQGIRTAIHMWPGSEAHIPDVEPTYVDKYNGSERLKLKVSRVLQLLDLPSDHDTTEPAAAHHRNINRRPQLIAYYVPNVDQDGHKYGPNSTEIRETISNVDIMLDHLFTGLQERNLTDIVNIVIVSDHGMATTSTDRLIQLEDLVDMDLIDHVDGWPLQGLRPKHVGDIPKLHEELREKAANNPNIDVYLRDTDMPQRWHFQNNDRIAPLWIMPKAGWAIVTKNEFNVQQGKKNGEIYHPRGLHGYDHEDPLMRAIFVARGPSFPHKPNSRVPVFQNTEVYNIVCDTLGISPSPNNGTLRLPLKPVGLHSDGKLPPLDTPDDPPTQSNGEVVSATPTQTSGSVQPDDGHDDQEKHGSDTTEDPDNEEAESKGWYEYFKDKLEEAKEWVKGFLHSHKDKDGD